MSIAWTIKGEAGKALDDTVRTVASLGVDSAVIDFRSLTDDILSLAVVTQDITTALLPELGQSVTIYRDGVQFFVGTVTSNPVSIAEGSHAARIEASGPWWWMERINFTQDQTDGAGNTEERISYVFGTASGGGNLQTHIQNAIDRAITLGVPMQRGTVASFFDVPRITLNQSTCGQALAELVRLVPDTMVWFDYSTSPPTINVSRRGTATTRTLDYDTGAITRIEIQPLIDLQVTQVRLPYVERDVQGRTVFNEQSSGSATTGKVQILTVSGPELDTFLPNDLFDSYQIQTVAPSSTALINEMTNTDSQIAAVKAKYNLQSIGVGSAEYFELYSGWTYGGLSGGFCGIDTRYSASIQVSAYATSFVNEKGQVVSPSGKFAVLTKDVPEWFLQQNPGVFTKVKVTAKCQYFLRTSTPGCGTNSTPSVIYQPPAWYNEITWDETYKGYYSYYISGGGYFTVTRKLLEFDTYLSTISWPTLETVYRESDYSFISPPINLAANLKSAQDWLPYEGDIEMIEQDAGGTRYRGCKVNVSNSFPQFGSMGALVSSERLDLKNGTTTITLGQPARLDFRTFVDRIRKTPQDNIVYL